ncbi:SGNH/GDSL hydrolase family protein [uncultured Sphingomonas sp.]|uniref:SGNH/GDSL hydrolase family protein n=1 Tax=uncultured Sphingomonas sp. TaxID=158754 RepID=UPI0025E4F4B4|nr:SGNH/GDSL hydrolase family protein [uncultured Sphingomonas sp.]
MRTGLLLWGAAVVAAAAPAGVQAKGWVRTWQAVPAETVSATSDGVASRLSNVTIRMPVRVSAGGTAIRLRLSNELSDTPLPLGPVHVAFAAEDGSVLPGSDRVVTFAGQQSPTIAPFAPLVSDAVALQVPARTRLLVSIHVPGGLSGVSDHPLGVATTRFGSGDQTGATIISGSASTTKRYVLSGVDVTGGSAVGTIAAFGDSITDGFNATIDADRRWPDVLAARLDRGGKLRFGVINAAISGNRLLLTGAGPAALARFDRDVLSVPGVKYVVILEGVNDIGSATRDGRPLPTPDTVIGAYRQMIERAHDKGVKVIGATILPYKGAGYYGTQGEVVRQAVNAWIRTPGHFDGVADFDRVTADRTDPQTIAAPYDSGDHLHPGDAGYQAMGQSIDLGLFR